MISRTQKPVIVELYEEMRKYMDNGTQLMPTYLKMVDSLRYLKKCKVAYKNSQQLENYLET